MSSDTETPPEIQPEVSEASETSEELPPVPKKRRTQKSETPDAILAREKLIAKQEAILAKRQAVKEQKRIAAKQAAKINHARAAEERGKLQKSYKIKAGLFDMYLNNLLSDDALFQAGFRRAPRVDPKRSEESKFESWFN